MTASFRFDVEIRTYEFDVCKRSDFELNGVSVAMIRPGARALPPSISGAESIRCGLAVHQQARVCGANSPSICRERYGYLEKSFDGDTSRCLA